MINIRSIEKVDSEFERFGYDPGGGVIFQSPPMSQPAAETDCAHLDSVLAELSILHGFRLPIPLTGKLSA